MLKDKTDFVGKVRLPGYDLYRCGWYPGIRSNPDNREGVECELYAIKDESVMETLDTYEGYREDDPISSLFVRKEVQIVDGPVASIYEYNYELRPDRIVASGIWEK